MLLIVKKFADLDFNKLMQVYAETNKARGSELYPESGFEQHILKAERDFHDYLVGFFHVKKSFYGILCEEDRYISALRIESYQDGLLLEALETRPDMRNRGYGKSLISQVLQFIRTYSSLPVYSHVAKNNTVSLHVHESCGFKKIKDTAAFIDGSVTSRSWTLCFYN